MKKLMYIALAAAAALTSCTKNNNDRHSPRVKVSAPVTINSTVYPTTVIGTQTWTALNYNGPGGEDYTNGTNDTTYGKLYTWDEAKAIALPAGWRLPTQADFINIMSAIGEVEVNGNYVPSGYEPATLMSPSNWTNANGSNTTNFKAEPAGFYNQVSANNQQFNGKGTTALFISATPYLNNGTYPFTFVVGPYRAGFLNLLVLPTDRASVRFVKDN